MAFAVIPLLEERALFGCCATVFEPSPWFEIEPALALWPISLRKTQNTPTSQRETEIL
jgi:hypothetical protein